jgi:hypothetical protein
MGEEAMNLRVMCEWGIKLTVLTIGLPLLAVAASYVYKGARYLLDGVFLWAIFLLKSIAICALLALVVTLLIFNVYAFTVYPHVEPQASIIGYVQTTYGAYRGTIDLVSAAINHLQRFF